MKITLSCMECFKERGIPSFKFKNIEINEDGLYEMECEHGHKTVTLLQNEKFEILFDMGISALLEGYKQEAVACIHSSMERFHEWCISVFLRSNNVPFEEIEKTWKYVKKQSERQLGAFYFLYLQAFKEAPQGFNDDKTGFRNQVIHNGYIPKYEEVFEYSQYVLNYIRYILKKIECTYEQSIMEVTFNRLNKLGEKYKGQITTSTSGETSILGLNYKEEKHKNMTLKDAIDYIKTKNELFSSLGNISHEGH